MNKEKIQVTKWSKKRENSGNLSIRNKYSM